MKKIILFTVLLVSFKGLAAQSVFYDAVVLKKYCYLDEKGVVAISINAENYSECVKALRPYLPYDRQRMVDSLIQVVNNSDSNLINNINDIISEIEEEFKVNNPYIIIANTAQSSPLDIKAFDKIGSKGFIGSVGGLNVTNFADGVAKFLVERMKKELSMAFFDKFKKDMERPEYSDLRILFPETWKTLYTIDKDIYQHSAYLNALRQSFIKDMTNQYLNIKKLLNQEKYRSYFKKEHPEAGTILYSALYFIDALSAGKHPGEVLKDYNVQLIDLCRTGDTTCNLKAVEDNLSGSIQVLQLISESLRSRSEKTYWIPSDSVEMLKNDTLLRIYMGLIYQMSKKQDIKFAGGKEFTTILDTLAPHIDSIRAYRDYIENFAYQATEVNQYLQELKDKKKAEIDYNDYYKLYSSSLDLLEHASGFAELPYLNIPEKNKEEMKHYTNATLYVARGAGNLYIDVRTENYTSAIVNVIHVLDTVMGLNNAFHVEEAEEAYEKAVNDLEQELKSNEAIRNKENKNLVRTIKEFETNKVEDTNLNWTVILDKVYSGNDPTTVYSNKQQIQDQVVQVLKTKRIYIIAKNKKDVRQKLLKYGSFIAAVAEAENSDDVKNAIEAVAMPPGSYSVKRRSMFDISINGYIGGTYDFSGGNKFHFDKRKDNNLLLNISVPIGIAFSHGIKNNFGSISCFASVIDVGVLAHYRMQSDSAVLDREIKLGDIFAPGLQFIYGIPNIPLSVSLGGTYRPSLLYSSGQGDFFYAPSVWTYNISLLIDIPIINLYNKTR